MKTRLIKAYTTEILRARAAYYRHRAALERGLSDDAPETGGRGQDREPDTPTRTPVLPDFFWT